MGSEMQTFLPYSDFIQSARCLDRQRLGKQRVEVLQLLNALTDRKGGWVNHPAAKMWCRYIPCLASYGIEIVAEWQRRGYKDSCREKILPYLTYKGQGFFDIIPDPP